MKALVPVIALMVMPAVTFAAHKPVQAPKEGDMAVSGSIGFARAFDDEFDNFEPILNGTFEYYTSDRISLRGMVGFTEFDHEFGGDAEIQFVDGNIVYNWEGGWIHPFVTGGVGIYDKDLSGPGPSRFDDGAEIGINAGGGLDFFFESRWAVKVEGLLHGISGDEPDSFFSGTVGAKYWF